MFGKLNWIGMHILAQEPIWKAIIKIFIVIRENVFFLSIRIKFDQTDQNIFLTNHK